MADRRHREIARALGNLEIGEDRGGEAAIFAVIAQRAFRFSCRAAGVVEGRDIVRSGEVARGRMAGLFDRGKQIDAINRPARA
jgi:hypothetical protein